MSTPVTLAVIGVGNRGGDVYAGWCLKHPDRARVVAVADPRVDLRNEVGDRHGIPAGRRYASWEELLNQPRLADGVIIATPDQMHVKPALRAMELGYDILLEKPIAPTKDELLQVAQAAERLRARGGSVTVAHVLRYTPFFSTLKRLLDQGRIGQVVSIQYTENIGYWHFAHSYVRGNWRREDTSSPMILAKSCHDMDMLRWLVGRPWRRIASFGSLLHFRPENAPEGAPERCTDGCPASERCPFDAVRFYVDRLAGHTGWPVSVITHDFSREGRLRALREGPYGRCVYRSDNDVVDHQVVSLEFEGGVTAAFTVCAFTEENTRTLKVMGTHGEIRGHLDKGELEIRSYLPGGAPGAGHEVVRVLAGSGHAGGDEGLMEAFTARLRARKEGRVPEEALTSLAESLDSHLMAFAAEESRREGRVVQAS